MKTRKTGKRPGRPTSAHVRADCSEITRMFAAGESEVAIRRRLRLSRRAYAHRLRALRRLSVDRHMAWTRFLTSAELDLRRLDEIGEEALVSVPPRYSVFIRVATVRARLRREIIEVGTALGIYDCGAASQRRAGPQPLRYRDLFGVESSPDRTTST